MWSSRLCRSRAVARDYVDDACCNAAVAANVIECGRFRNSLHYLRLPTSLLSAPTQPMHLVKAKMWKVLSQRCHFSFPSLLVLFVKEHGLCWFFVRSAWLKKWTWRVEQNKMIWTLQQCRMCLDACLTHIAKEKKLPPIKCPVQLPRQKMMNIFIWHFCVCSK